MLWFDVSYEGPWYGRRKNIFHAGPIIADTEGEDNNSMVRWLLLKTHGSNTSVKNVFK